MCFDCTQVQCIDQIIYLLVTSLKLTFFVVKICNTCIYQILFGQKKKVIYIKKSKTKIIIQSYRQSTGKLMEDMSTAFN